MKIKIIIIALLIVSHINAKILYKIHLKNENGNIVISNNLQSPPSSESAIDENPNPEESINQWAVFLKNYSNQYNSPFMFESGISQKSSEEGFEEDCYEECPTYPLTIEEIIEELKTPEVFVDVGDIYPEWYWDVEGEYPIENEILIFPIENGLNNTIKGLRLGHNVKEITGMSNVQIIKNKFEAINNKTISYENLSNLKKIGGSLRISDNFNNYGSVDMSFLRNLQEVEHISISNKYPINISKINKNVVMDEIFISSEGYILNEEDSYWIRDKVKNKTINKVIFYKLSNNDLKVLEGVDYLNFANLYGYPNLENLQDLNSVLTINYLSISGMNSLTNFEGLNNLTTVNKLLEVRYNENLVSTKGLESLTVAKELDFTFNNINDLTGLKNLVSVDIFLLGYNNLSNLDGLESLREAGEILIGHNNILDNINGLKNLEKIDNLNFLGVKVLDISGLSGLREVTGFITFNEIEGGFRVKLPRDSYLCKNTNKMRMYTFDNKGWNKSEVCE